jgi:hypothetical protein
MEKAAHQKTYRYSVDMVLQRDNPTKNLSFKKWNISRPEEDI